MVGCVWSSEMARNSNAERCDDTLAKGTGCQQLTLVKGLLRARALVGMTNLQDQLAQAINDYLETQILGKDSTAIRGGQTKELLPQAQEIARELVVQAVAEGMPLTRFSIEGKPLGGGNTAGLVATATLHAPFVFKFDLNSKKLSEEGVLMRALRNNPKLPPEFRESFPRVYAVRAQPPYAYLMEIFPKEEGYHSLEDLLYPSAGAPPSFTMVGRFVNKALDLLFLGYENTVDRRSQPNLFADYIDRIRGRLTETAARDGRFASRSVEIPGKACLTPWEENLRVLDRNRSKILTIAPAFITHVHGDPNPGNIILRATDTDFEIKQIDPKEWATGDYLFDVTKITHFLEGTGPAEKTAYGAAAVTRFETVGDKTILEYTLPPIPWTPAAVEAVRERAAAFAHRHGDEHWELRYQLGMASNLLGLPLGRLERKHDAAAILYGEGLKWLEKFRDSVEKL